MGRNLSEHFVLGRTTLSEHFVLGRTWSEHFVLGRTLPEHFVLGRILPEHFVLGRTWSEHFVLGRTLPEHLVFSHAPTWWATFTLATKAQVVGVRLPSAVNPTLRTKRTSSKNLSGTNPVQSWLFLRETRGSEVVASPLGEAQVLRKIAS
jgi:hypothetical protein